MAGDWIKVEKATARKPEVLRLADMLDIHPDHAFGLCVRFWFWCDDQLVDGHAPTVTSVTLNSIVGHNGFAEAMTEVGWLKAKGKRLCVPNFDRHLSESAKNRALSQERKRKQRQADDTALSRATRDDTVTRARGEQEVDRLLMSNRKAIGSSAPADSRLPRLPKDAQREGRQAYDLSSIDWSAVEATAEAVGRKVPPATPEDRRNWLRFGVMIQLWFSEDWLTDSVEAVVHAKATKRTKQAHLYGVLKSKAQELGQGNTFRDAMKGIEIPGDVWKSSVLGGPK